jgi:hypothetical protein
MKPACTDREFMEAWQEGGAALIVKRYGSTERNAYRRRKSLQLKHGVLLPPRANVISVASEHPERVYLTLRDGVVLVGSDGHYWPGQNPTAHRAFVHFIKKLQPSIVVMNGDAFDGARVSRHSPIGWENRPEVVNELEAVKERLGEIELATPRKVPLVWPLGNHDGRFETRLATVAPEFARLNGFHLKDHVGARWEPCWSLWINEGGPGHTVIKHRYRGGEHAGHNNAIRSGVHMVTGHDHALKVTPFTDYRGTRWGVGCGCLSDTFGPQFTDYTEDNPRNQRSGFAVLTYRDGFLLPPELAQVCEFEPDAVVFRGEVVKV